MNNLSDIVQGVSVTTLLGLGITLSLTVGGFNMSVGNTAALASMMTSHAQVVWGWGATSTLALLTGTIIDGFNALLTVPLHILNLLPILGTLFQVGGLQLIRATAAKAGECHASSSAHYYIQSGAGETRSLPDFRLDGTRQKFPSRSA